mmetsp:Transcript_3254/g.9079  ORF Transcript_3254/g.9079 Transcript_3254/m.9079 type:complete len:335 (+) Transcript_3254:842-1846(+)
MAVSAPRASSLDMASSTSSHAILKRCISERSAPFSLLAMRSTIQLHTPAPPPLPPLPCGSDSSSSAHALPSGLKLLRKAFTRGSSTGPSSAAAVAHGAASASDSAPLLPPPLLARSPLPRFSPPPFVCACAGEASGFGAGFGAPFVARGATGRPAVEKKKSEPSPLTIQWLPDLSTKLTPPSRSRSSSGSCSTARCTGSAGAAASSGVCHAPCPASYDTGGSVCQPAGGGCHRPPRRPLQPQCANSSVAASLSGQRAARHTIAVGLPPPGDGAATPLTTSRHSGRPEMAKASVDRRSSPSPGSSHASVASLHVIVSAMSAMLDTKSKLLVGATE